LSKELTILDEVKKNAVWHIQDMAAGEVNLVIRAAAAGAALNSLKALIPHGEFIPWLKENAGEKERQCRNYMNLAKARPDLLEADAKTALNAVLDIQTEAKMLFLDEGNNEAKQIIRKTAKELDLKQAELAKELTALKNRLAEAENTVETKAQTLEEWRQQAIKEKRARQTAEDTAAHHIQQARTLRGNHEAEIALGVNEGIKPLKQKVRELEQRNKEDRKHDRQSIDERVAAKLREQQDKINDLQAQEQAMEGRIKYAQGIMEPLNDDVAIKMEHDDNHTEIQNSITAIMAAITTTAEVGALMSIDIPKWNRLAGNLKITISLLDQFLSGQVDETYKAGMKLLNEDESHDSTH